MFTPVRNAAASRIRAESGRKWLSGRLAHGALSFFRWT